MTESTTLKPNFSIGSMEYDNTNTVELLAALLMD